MRLEHKSRNLECRKTEREEKKQPKWSVIKISQDLYTKKALGDGRPGSLASNVAGNVLEIEPPLKRMPWFKSGTCIIKEEKLSGLILHNTYTIVYNNTVLLGLEHTEITILNNTKKVGGSKAVLE